MNRGLRLFAGAFASAEETDACDTFFLAAVFTETAALEGGGAFNSVFFAAAPALLPVGFGGDLIVTCFPQDTLLARAGWSGGSK